LTSRTTARFRKAFEALPAHVQDRARTAFRQFKQDPSHSSLRFKQVHSSQPVYSARVGLGYRALAVKDQDVYIWFWIGTHGDYDRLLKDL